MANENGLMIGDKIERRAIMTCFEGYCHDDDGQRWIRITDHRSGEEWDESIAGWTFYLNDGGYYQNRDGRIVKLA